MKVHLEFGGGLEKKKSFRGRYEVQNSKLIETVDNWSINYSYTTHVKALIKKIHTSLDMSTPFF